MLNLHLKNWKLNHQCIRPLRVLGSIPFVFPPLWSLKRSADVRAKFYKYSEDSSVPISDLPDTLEYDRMVLFISTMFLGWVFSFSAKRHFFFLVWVQQKWFHDFWGCGNLMIFVWCGNLAHAQKLFQLNAFVLWGFQLSVWLACPWPGSLMHGGWILLLLAW